jgi:hypothetical protein
MDLRITIRRKQGGQWSGAARVPVQPKQDWEAARLSLGECVLSRGSGLATHTLSVAYDDIPELIAVLAQALVDRAEAQRRAS